jgi:hypothetical protein
VDAFVVASTNLHLADSLATRTRNTPVNEHGRPPNCGVVAYADVFTADADSNAPPSAV